MVLNLTPYAFNTLILGCILVIVSIFILRNPTTQKIRSILYLKILYFCGALYFLFDGISYFLLPDNPLLAKTFNYFENISIVVLGFCLILTISYILKGSYALVGYIFIGVVGGLSCYTGLLPGSMEIIFKTGYYKVDYFGPYLILTVIMIAVLPLTMFAWNFMIWRKAPVSIKKEASIFFLGAILIAPVAFTLYLIHILIFPFLMMLSDWSLIIGMSIIAFMLKKEPRLLFVLPFIPYRIVIQNLTGHLVFQHIWTPSKISEPNVPNLSETLQKRRQELDLARSTISITIKDETLLIQESNTILVGLFVSKSSKYLTELVDRFTLEFEENFRDNIEDPSAHPIDLNSAYELLEKYFSIFPSRIVRDEKRPVFLGKPYWKIPPEVEEKLLQVMSPEELETLKCDVQRSSMEVPAEFLALFEELEREPDEDELEKEEKREE